MALNANQAFYLLIDDKGIASMSMTLGIQGFLKYFKDDFIFIGFFC